MRLDRNASNVLDILKEARGKMDAQISGNFQSLRDEMLQAEEELLRVMEARATSKQARKMFHTERLWAAAMIAAIAERTAAHWKRKAVEIQETIDSLED